MVVGQLRGVESEHESLNNWLHVQDGLYFRRTEDGSVEVGKNDGFSSSPIEIETIIPANSWGTVVATVSAFGDNPTSHRFILDFHSGELLEMFTKLNGT